MNNNKKVAILFCGLVLSSCKADLPVNPAAGANRFDISHYQESLQADDLQGMWVVIHEGELHETSGNVSYTVSGYIRELVQIRERQGAYYVRTCVEPEVEHLMEVSAESVRMQMNADVAELTRHSNTRMAGTAAHDDADSDYNGVVAMRKVAPLGQTFGLFDFYDANQVLQPVDVSCFQEGKLQVVGSMLGVSQWANVDIASIAQWDDGGGFRHLSFLVSREGSADPVRELSFSDGVLGNTTRVQREYSSGVTVSSVSASISHYQTVYQVGDVVSSGEVGVDYPLAAEFIVGEEGDAASPQLQQVDDGQGEVVTSDPEWLMLLQSWGEWLRLGSWWRR